MADGGARGQPWLEENGLRDFPLVSGFAGKSWNRPEWTVPKWLFRDYRAFVCTRSRDVVVDPMCSRLSHFWFGRADDGVSVDVLVAVKCAPGDPRYYGFPKTSGHIVFPVTATVPYGSTALVKASASSSDLGAAVSVSMVLGSPPRGSVSLWPSEYVLFQDPDTGGVPFLPSRTVVFPGGMGVSRLVVGDEEATGTVHLQDGVQTTSRIQAGGIRVNAAPGIGVHPDCWEYDPTRTCDSIHYINGVHADTDGNFQIVGGEGVSVVSGLRLNGHPAVAVVTDPIGNRVRGHYSSADSADSKTVNEWRERIHSNPHN